MKTALAVMALMIACLFTTNSIAEDSSRFQSLSGDYGRSIISDLKANDSTQQAAAASGNGNNTLWNWGTVPKGSVVNDGKLVNDPTNTWNSIDLSGGWAKVLGVDTFTGNTIYSYQVPSTGVTKYFYIDPYTETAVYVDKDSFTLEVPVTGNSGSIGNTGNTGNSATGSGSYALPAIFS